MAPVLLLAVTSLVPAQSRAVVTWTVTIRDCSFRPDFRAIEVGDSVMWSYDEGDCNPANHRVRTFGSPPESFDSGECDGPFSPEPSCLNDQPFRQERYQKAFPSAGTYNYYCPIHSEVVGSRCTGSMCGQIRVVAEPSISPPPPPPPTSPPPSPRRTSPSPTPSGTATGTVTATPTATATATILGRGDDEPGGGGGSRWLIALLAVAVLGAAAFFVWRTYIAAPD